MARWQCYTRLWNPQCKYDLVMISIMDMFLTHCEWEKMYKVEKLKYISLWFNYLPSSIVLILQVELETVNIGIPWKMIESEFGEKWSFGMVSGCFIKRWIKPDQWTWHSGVSRQRSLALGTACRKLKWCWPKTNASNAITVPAKTAHSFRPRLKVVSVAFWAFFNQLLNYCLGNGNTRKVNLNRNSC